MTEEHIFTDNKHVDSVIKQRKVSEKQQFAQIQLLIIAIQLYDASWNAITIFFVFTISFVLTGDI